MESIARLRTAGIKVIVMANRNKESIQWIDNMIETGSMSLSEDNICKIDLLDQMQEEEQRKYLLRFLQTDKITYATFTKGKPYLKMRLCETLKSLVPISLNPIVKKLGS